MELRDLYPVYQAWCQANGHKNPLSQNKLRIEINAMALPGVRAGQRYADGERVVRGIVKTNPNSGILNSF